MIELVQKAIEDITYQSKKFPERSFRIISENEELAIPYLCAAIEKAVEEQENLEENYQLHFYAMHLLAQFQCRECFPQMMQMVRLPSDTLDFLIGDAITSTLHNVLYNTYNGNLEILKKTIQDPEVDEFARGGMLKVMGQLYLDGKLGKEEWQEFIRKMINAGNEMDDYLYTELANIICDCHMVEMLPEIMQLCAAEQAEADYAAYVDMMFSYEEKLCRSPVNAADMLRGWAMFDESPQKEFGEKDMDRILRALDAQYKKPVPKIKIGRNDPCPCGSGKKYKKCCLNKPKSPVDLIESEAEKQKWLKHYPASAKERVEGRIYLEDFFDSESIEIDKLIYLALNFRPRPIWIDDDDEDAVRKKVYLTEAFSKFTEKVERENIETFDEYDEKYSIHYQCAEWISELETLLDDSGESNLSEMVSACWDRMGEVHY